MVVSERAVAVGEVAELWRYPVKSMLGERLSGAEFGVHGAVGDRAWALVDEDGGRVVTATRFPVLLGFRASYDTQPTADAPGRVRLETPDGMELDPADGERASRVISAVLGRAVRLERRVEGFTQVAPLLVLASGSVDQLRAVHGDPAAIDRRRFRPTVYVRSWSDSPAYVEDGWLGSVLEIGNAVRCTDLEPMPWCAMSTLAVEDLPHDPRVLRTLVQDHDGCLGVCARVGAAGYLRVGDPVLLGPVAT